MDKPMLESRLKLYKQHKAEVETTLKRIEVWREMLKKGELEYFEESPPDNLGMPKAKNITSPVENMAVKREITRETVEQWISDESSRVLYKKLEVEHIEIAVDALTAEQKCVIETKYFNGMNWRNIEIVYNQRFSGNRIFLTEGRLKQINNEALEMIWAILAPLYNRYLYFKQCRAETMRVAEKQKIIQKVAEK